MVGRRVIPLPEGLSAGPSRIAGEGLFTTVARREGERVAVVDGVVIDGNEAERLDALGNVYIYEIDDDTYVDAAERLGRLVNHSCLPSCRVEVRDPGSLWLVAERDLPAGSEITIDYDYPEIFDACREHNPECLRDACSRWQQARAAEPDAEATG